MGKLVCKGDYYRFAKDQLGSVKLVINAATMAVSQTITYDDYGQVLSDSNIGYQPFGYAGGLYDADTKLVRFGARDYDPEVGRWTAKDPIRFAGGDTNLYGYCGSDTVNCVDPTGHFWQVVTGVVAGTINAYQNYQATSQVQGASTTQVALSTAAGFATGFFAGAASASNPLASGAISSAAVMANNAVNQYIFNGQISNFSSIAAAGAVGFASGLTGGALTGAAGGLGATRLGESAIGAFISPLGFNGPNGIPECP